MYHNKSGLYYEVIGNLTSKENLVFVHGSGCDRRFLISLAEKLIDFKCYLIDLPDHGRSPFRNITKVEGFIDAAAEFVSELSNVTLIGHSLGGTICLGIAAKMLPSVKRSVIISSGAKFDKLGKEIHEMVRKHKVNWLYMIKCLGSICNISVIKTLLTLKDSNILLKDFKIDIELDIEHVINDIKIPVLIMVGNEDILTIPEYSYKLKKLIKRSKLVLVPGYKHMLPIADKKNVSYMIRKFVQKVN